MKVLGRLRRVAISVSRFLAVALLYIFGLAIAGAMLACIYWAYAEPTAILTSAPLIAVSGALLVAFMRSVRTVPNRGLSVLYCRRFAERGTAIERRNQWFEQILVDACRGLAVPVTLRDESVRSSSSLAAGINAAVGLVGVLLAVATLFFVTENLVESQSVPGLLVFLVVAICLLTLGLLMYGLREWLLESIGSRIAGPDRIRVLQRRMAERRSAPVDLLVLRSTNEDWQTHVESVLEEADRAIVDLTSDTENIGWEVARSLEVLGPDQVLFVKASTEDGVDCSRTRLPEFSTEQDLFVLRFCRKWMRRQADQAPLFEPESRAVAKALHDWLEDQRVTTADGAGEYLQSLLGATSSARRRAGVAYALIASVFVVLALRRPSLDDLIAHPGIGVLAFVVAVAAYLVARVVLAFSGLKRTPGGAMSRGAGVAAATFALLYVPVSLFVVVAELFDGGEVAELVLALGIFFVMGLFFLPLGGAVVGLLIEYVFLRPPTLDRHDSGASHGKDAAGLHFL